MSTLQSFSYCLTSDIDMNIRINIQSLEGVQKMINNRLNKLLLINSNENSKNVIDVFLTCQIFAYNRPLCSEIKTQYYSLIDEWSTWNEWLVIPVKYKHIPIGAQITLTVWEATEPRTCKPIGGCTLPLFGKSNTLITGEHKLYIWPEQEADGNTPSTTPAIVHQSTEMDRLEKAMRRHERGDILEVDWLDHLAYREIERVNKLEKKNNDKLYLYVYLPKFNFPIVFHEIPYLFNSNLITSNRLPGAIGTDIFETWITDPESNQENPIEEKHRKLTRSHRSAAFDITVKPNSKIRDELKIIVGYPPTQILTNEEKDLLWKYRYYLIKDKKALTKFLKSVTWNDKVEVNQAKDLLAQWIDIDIADALELLGPNFIDSDVRKYAVNQLKRANDDELLLYLLQLVQALKFEIDTNTNNNNNITNDNVNNNSNEFIINWLKESKLLGFLIERSLNNEILGHYFYWYLCVENDQTNKEYGIVYHKIIEQYENKLLRTKKGSMKIKNFKRQQELINKLVNLCTLLSNCKESRIQKIEILKDYLKDNSNKLENFDEPFPLPLDPTIIVTGIISEKANIFKSSLQPLFLIFKCQDGSTYPIIFKSGDDLRQDQLIMQLITLMDKLLRRENLDLKLTKYKILATAPYNGMVQFIPSLSLASIINKHGSILNYLKLISNNNNNYNNNNSIANTISSNNNNESFEFDSTIHNENFDNNNNINNNTNDNNNNNNNNNSNNNIDNSNDNDNDIENIDNGNGMDISLSNNILDTYIRSLAGYCVITNIFGIGDRHLDNLLLTPKGNLFHIDFGYIFGRDPKPFPPPIKLSKEMVEAMGGNLSKGYIQFISYSCTIFNSLRKTSNLILNLLSLMIKSQLPDINIIEPDKIVMKVQEKYRLDLKDEEAMNYFESAVINDSLAAVLPQVMEKIHQVAQLLRS